VDPRPYIAKKDPNYPMRTMGVVEKCTLCVERLARGLEPACVEASNGAMVFGNLADPDSEIRKILNTKFTLRRKPSLGTMPSVFYVIGGDRHAR
jgi:molybdopterin-containing oxidoreductase family iron-sulfur binding subunit